MAYLHRDYAHNELLDRYSEADIDDDGDVEEISAAARRAAEAQMARRDRLERAGKRGQRAARRSYAPTFLGSDNMDNEYMEDDLGIALMKKRTRKQYDERPDLDDLEGVEDVSCSTNFALHAFLSFKSYRNCLWNNLVTLKRNPSLNG